MSHSDDARIAWGWTEEGDELFEKGDFEGAIKCYDQVLVLQFQINISITRSPYQQQSRRPFYPFCTSI